jgi:hypothetical protein
MRALMQYPLLRAKRCFSKLPNYMKMHVKMLVFSIDRKWVCFKNSKIGALFDSWDCGSFQSHPYPQVNRWVLPFSRGNCCAIKKWSKWILSKIAHHCETTISAIQVFNIVFILNQHASSTYQRARDYDKKPVGEKSIKDPVG